MDYSHVERFIEAQKAQHAVDFHEKLTICNQYVVAWLVSRDEDKLILINELIGELLDLAYAKWGTNTQQRLVTVIVNTIDRAQAQ